MRVELECPQCGATTVFGWPDHNPPRVAAPCSKFEQVNEEGVRCQHLYQPEVLDENYSPPPLESVVAPVPGDPDA